MPPTSFLPSELITNPDGSIYHIGLQPDDLPDYVITVGDPERVERVSRHFDSIEKKVRRREFVSHIGRIGGQRLLVISTGIGTDNVEIVLAELDALANVDLATRTTKPAPRRLRFLRFGTTGTLLEDLEAGNFIISEEATGLDALGLFYDFSDTGGLVRPNESLQLQLGLSATPYSVKSAFASLNAAARAFATPAHTLTCPGFFVPQGRNTRFQAGHKVLDRAQVYNRNLPPNHLPFTNFEMETAGLFALGALMGHEVASLSLVVANRITGQFLQGAEARMDAMIAKGLQALAGVMSSEL